MVLAGVMLGSVAASAQEAEEPEGIAPILAKLEFHGFVSQGFLITTENNYLADSEGGSFQFSEAGLNLTIQLTDTLRAGMQLFTRKLGPVGGYRASFDWYYIDYRPRDWFGLRVGRVKLPLGLYNDTSDIDAARTAVLLPGSLYPAQNRDFLLAHTGVEAYGYVPLGAAGSVEYRLSAGAIFLDRPANTPLFTYLELTIPYIIGGRLLWEPPVEGLRIGGSVHATRLDAELAVTGVPMPVTVRIPVILWIASAEYAHRNLLLAAEYSRWVAESESSDPMAFPEDSQVNERAYVMATYRLRRWLHPGVYYSLLFPDTRSRTGRERQQHDVAVTFRFDINPYWLIKLEAHYMHGTAGIQAELNDLPLSELAPDWGLFLAKTTAYL